MGNAVADRELVELRRLVRTQAAVLNDWQRDRDEAVLIMAERDRYKAEWEKLRAEADRAADMLTNGENAVKVFHVLDKALAALSPTPPKEPSHE